MKDESADDFRIDSDRIFVGGVSAGAIASLNAVYISNESEALSLVSQDYLDSIGGLEGNSGNPGYSSEVHGIVNFCGAIGDASWIDEGDVPIVSMHGDQDGTVPYDDSLVTLFGLNVQVFGSYIIDETMNNLGNYSLLHTYSGQGHIPFSANNMDFEIQFTSEFLYNVVCSDSEIILGDINQDSIINVLDVVVLINYILLADYPDSDQFFASDMNTDGDINVLDVVLLVGSILDS